MLKVRLLLLVVAIASGVNGYSECIKQTPTPTNEDWIKTQGRLGFNVIENSKCNNCLNNEEWSWMDGRSILGQKTMCWLMDIVTPKARIHVPMTCTYNKIEFQDCQVDFSGSIAKHLSFAGKVSFSLTDNENYFAGTFCLFGKENFWFYVSKTREPHGNTLEEAKEHFKKRGFIAPVAVEGVSKMTFRAFRIVDCIDV